MFRYNKDLPVDSEAIDELYEKELQITSSPLIYNFLQNRTSGGMTTYMDSVMNMRCIDIKNNCIKDL